MRFLFLSLSLLILGSCSGSGSSGTCKSNSDCSDNTMPYCDTSAGKCTAPPALCSSKPVWFQADNGGNHYTFGTAPFKTASTASPYTQSYAALDAECVKQATILQKSTQSNKELGLYNWQAMVIMSEDGKIYNQTAVTRNNYQMLTAYNTTTAGGNPAVDPIQCAAQVLYLASTGTALSTTGTDPLQHPALLGFPSNPNPVTHILVGQTAITDCQNLSSATAAFVNGYPLNGIFQHNGITNMNGIGWSTPLVSLPQCSYSFDLICVAQMP